MNPLHSASPSMNTVDRPRPGSRRLWLGLSMFIIVVAAIGVWIAGFKGWPLGSKASQQETDRAVGSPSDKQGQPVTVEVVYPMPGGIDRVSVQPGTVEPFQSADLYAKVSGFLVDSVDIGKRVEKNDVLATISVPEYKRQVEKDAANVKRSKTRVQQMKAQLLASQSEEKAAKQTIVQAKIELKSKSFYRSYRSKLLERIKLLQKDNAIEAKVVDEDTDRFEAAMEAENAAREAIDTAELKWGSSKAKVSQSEADIEEAEAQVEVAQAELERSKVFLDYTVIKSPFDGVVTKRNFNPGDFIRSADAGSDRIPIIAVDCTDKMRIVVQVPDRDVSFVDVGDSATIEIPSLKGKPLHGTVARFANAEDAQTRTMRTEIDLPNKDGKLVRNMYGRVRLFLQPGAPTTMRIASTALFRKDEGAQTMVRVIRDHRVHLVPVETGTDTGAEVEILSGLTIDDLVILRGNGPLDEGTEVVESNGSNAVKH